MNKRFQLSTVEGRQATFKKFTAIEGAPLCNPEGYARAGFYNISNKNNPDLVKCFACGKELGNWEPRDDPWKEHLRRGKDCPFVTLRQKFDITLEDFLSYYAAVTTASILAEVEKTKTAIEKEYQRILDLPDLDD